jgi:hypothetical protein
VFRSALIVPAAPCATARRSRTRNGSSDYFPQGKRWWLRLHEKGGKHHEMPVHHILEEYLDRYTYWESDERRLRQTARDLLKALQAHTEAAQAVIDHWAEGDLAAAIRGLDASIDGARSAIAKAKGGGQ